MNIQSFRKIIGAFFEKVNDPLSEVVVPVEKLPSNLEF